MQNIIDNFSLPLVVVVILVLGVIFVNGWTDAPNAIATAVSTRSMTAKNAIIMAVIMNFLGVLLMTYISTAVADTMSNMVSFDADDTRTSLIVLCAALIAIIIWASAATVLGIPTSESHALIAGLTGGAMSLGGLDAINFVEWKKVIIGLGLSSILGFIMGFIVTKIVQFIFKNVQRQKANKFFKNGQIAAAGGMAFLHGAQDGQKFMGVLMLGLYLNGLVQKNVQGSFNIPIWVMIIASIVMGIGTSVGGYNIIKSVGMDMVKLEVYQGFSSDLAAGFCLLLASLTGLPVSTTHTKTTAIMGAGTARRASSVDWSIVKEMLIAWGLTFPGCGLIGFIMGKLFLLIF